MGSSPDIDGPVPLEKDDLWQSFYNGRGTGISVCLQRLYYRLCGRLQKLPVFNPSLGVAEGVRAPPRRSQSAKVGHTQA